MPTCGFCFLSLWQHMREKHKRKKIQKKKPNIKVVLTEKRWSRSWSSSLLLTALLLLTAPLCSSMLLQSFSPYSFPAPSPATTHVCQVTAYHITWRTPCFFSFWSTSSCCVISFMNGGQIIVLTTITTSPPQSSKFDAMIVMTEQYILWVCAN